jgi:hypothetical protein
VASRRPNRPATSRRSSGPKRELAQAQKAVLDDQVKNTRDAAREQLQAQKDAIKDEIDARKDAENEHDRRGRPSLTLRRSRPNDRLKLVQDELAARKHARLTQDDAQRQALNWH